MPRKKKSLVVAETAAPEEETFAAVAADDAPPERGMSHVDEMLVGMGATASPDADAAADAATTLDEIPIDPFATYWTEFDLNCRHCQIVHYVPLCLFLNAEESPVLVQRIVSGHFNLKRCPVCRRIEYVEHPYTYYDPARKLIVQVRPEWEWKAGGGEEWYDARLEDLFDKWAEHDVRIEVVFGPQPLIDRFLQETPAPPARR